MHFKVSAPGRLTLHGEHVVVYGMAAVVTSMNLRTEVTVESAKSDVTLTLNDLGGKQFKWSKELFEEGTDIPFGRCDLPLPKPEILNLFHETFGLSPTDEHYQSAISFLFLYVGIRRKAYGKFLPLDFSVSSKIPIAVGLASSAAYSVALAAALLKAFGLIEGEPGELPEEELNVISDWGYRSEIIFHGRPTGIDNTICTFGGALMYAKQKIRETCTSVPMFRILLINTKVSTDMKKMIENVRTRYDRLENVIESVFETIDEVSDSSWRVFKGTKIDKDKKFETEAGLITINHQLLCALGVSHPLLDKMVLLATGYNFAAKLTGAGRGGCGFVLIDSIDSVDNLPPNKEMEELKGKLEAEGLEVSQTILCGPGVAFSS